jgi:hypothetical protein
MSIPAFEARLKLERQGLKRGKEQEQCCEDGRENKSDSRSRGSELNFSIVPGSLRGHIFD